jgi:two-component system cell cycle response regulator
MARILVIEDNVDNLRLMTYLLEAYGHSVVTAADGPEGLRRAESENADLIICDVHLPGIDGHELARRFKADPALAPTPLLAVTALAMVGDRERVLQVGFDGYLSKPIEPELFVHQVEELLPAELRGLAPREQAPGIARNARPEASTLATILVVDDTAINRELIRDMLTPSGYEVLAASGVEEALGVIAETPPDLILSDLNMPDEDGFGLVRRVRADPRLADVPLVMISSSSREERSRAMALGLAVNRFLLRPIEPQVLLHEIAACLTESREPGDAGDS